MAKEQSQLSVDAALKAYQAALTEEALAENAAKLANEKLAAARAATVKAQAELSALCGFPVVAK